MKEANELLEIWKDWLEMYIGYTTYKKAWKNLLSLREWRRDRYCVYRYQKKEVLNFWTLKAKIDMLIQENKELKKKNELLNKAIRVY